MDLEDFRGLIKRYQERGLDPVERLNALGLLLTDERRNELVRETCSLLAERLELEPLHKLTGIKRGVSLRDMRDGICEYIRKNFSNNQVK